MKRTKFSLINFLLLSCILTASVIAQISVPQQGLDAISPDTMYSHVAYLSTDEMRGRNTPSPELDLCAEYIANYFKNCGLSPASQTHGFFQEVPLLKTRLDGVENQQFILNKNKEKTVYQIKKDFVPVNLTANRTVTAPVVFAGYGITAHEYNYDDYASIDVQGKIVMVFSHEPQEDDSTSLFDGVKKTDHSKLENKVINAIDHGAVGLIYVTNPSHLFRRPPNKWPSLMRNAPKDGVPLTLGEKMENKIVISQIGKKLAQDIFANYEKTMEQIHKEIDATYSPIAFEFKNITVTMTTQLKAEQFVTKNVVGLWQGNDPQLSDEIVIIGGHYDHIGARNDTTIFNGADDNASGTAGVMAAAKAFTSIPVKPKRSILFMAFTGEEKGLYGSRFYTGSDPLFPLEKTAAMINLDMIGRSDQENTEIYGWDSSPQIEKAFLKANETIGLAYEFKDGKKMRGGSDHMSFNKKNIPNIFFNTGLHKDLHKPTDTIEKIDREKMAKVTRLVFSLAWRLANIDEKPDFVKP